MRNGNKELKVNDIDLEIVLILPMRNGNMNSLYGKFAQQNVLILPMRNGNPFITPPNLDNF